MLKVSETSDLANSFQFSFHFSKNNAPFPSGRVSHETFPIRNVHVISIHVILYPPGAVPCQAAIALEFKQENRIQQETKQVRDIWNKVEWKKEIILSKLKSNAWGNQRSCFKAVLSPRSCGYTYMYLPEYVWHHMLSIDTYPLLVSLMFLPFRKSSQSRSWCQGWIVNGGGHFSVVSLTVMCNSCQQKHQQSRASISQKLSFYSEVKPDDYSGNGSISTCPWNMRPNSKQKFKSLDLHFYFITFHFQHFEFRQFRAASNSRPPPFHFLYL